MALKKCKKCNQTKPLSEFYKNKLMTSGYLNTCKLCVDQYRDRWRELNKDKYINSYKQYAVKNSKKIKQYNKEYAVKNRERIKKRVSKWGKDNA